MCQSEMTGSVKQIKIHFRFTIPPVFQRFKEAVDHAVRGFFHSLRRVVPCEIGQTELGTTGKFPAVTVSTGQVIGPGTLKKPIQTLRR